MALSLHHLFHPRPRLRSSFITAVDYFSYLYPDASVDRIFAVVYMLVGLIGLFLIILYSHKTHAFVRINIGLALFVISLLAVPLLDAFYIKGRVGLYDGFYVTVAAVGLSGVADALVQVSILGTAGELPERYMQAIIAGTACSGIFLITPVAIFGLVFSFGVSLFYIKIETLISNVPCGDVLVTGVFVSYSLFLRNMNT